MALQILDERFPGWEQEVVVGGCPCCIFLESERAAMRTLDALYPGWVRKVVDEGGCPCGAGKRWDEVCELAWDGHLVLNDTGMSSSEVPQSAHGAKGLGKHSTASDSVVVARPPAPSCAISGCLPTQWYDVPSAEAASGDSAEVLDTPGAETPPGLVLAEVDPEGEQARKRARLLSDVSLHMSRHCMSDPANP